MGREDNTPIDANALFQQVVVHFQQGRVTEAELLAQKILSDSPGHADANHLMGVIALQRGQYEAAVEINAEAESETGFTIDLSPNAVILLDNSSDAGPKLGEYMTLHAVESSDFDSAFATLSFDWTLEEKPASSASELKTYSANGHSVQLWLDVAGGYKISLKVTDPEGRSDLAVESFTVFDQ